MKATKGRRMGLDAIGIRFLLYARQRGVDFSRTAMMGRQEMTLSLDELENSLRSFGYRGATLEGHRYAEHFLCTVLGAEKVVSFDANGFEGATHIHDFNLPVDEGLNEQFNAVIDGGTLEHVFNFPQAISNCMKMVKPGGHFLGIMPTNNYSGHGFYQFSPELIFRVFSPDNGFTCEVKRAIVGMSEWLQVRDPQASGHREPMESTSQTLLLVMAKKLTTVPLFSRPVQQSDYAFLWGR